MGGALVLTREEHQRIRISLPDGREIWLTVAEIGRGKVRLAFRADSDIRIDREEVAIQRDWHKSQAV